MIPAGLAILALTAVLLYVLRDHSKERTAWAKERNLLISRIQSPEIAPTLVERDEPVSLEPQHVPLDDDKAWDDLLKERS